AIRIPSAHRQLQIVPLTSPPPAAGPVVHADEIEAAPTVADGHTAVSQHADTELLEKAHPLQLTRVVLVVAGDKPGAEPRLEVTERRDRVAQVRHAAVDEIAGDDDEVRLEAHGLVDQGVQVPAADEGPHVDVGQLDDPQPIQ